MLAMIGMALQIIAMSGLTPEKARKWIMFVAALAGRGDITEAELRKGVEVIRKGVSEDRGPTVDEWQVYRIENAAANAEFNSWRAENM